MLPTQEFIYKHRKSLKCASEYYNVDSELMPRNAYDDADFRLIIVFPSDVTDKGKSMTRDVINDFIRTACPGVFVDFCYLPCEKDRKVFDRECMPYIIGNITHLDASHYDGIGFSLALNHEGMTAVSLLATCERCDTPIPLTWSERKNLPVGTTPIIWCGGMASSVNDICFGELGDGRQAFFDFMVLGEIYCEAPMFKYFAKFKHDGELTVQMAIQEIWKATAIEGDMDLHRHIYQPQAYRVVYDNTHTIVENSRIDANAPEYCVPYTAMVIPAGLLGPARTIIAGNGSNVNDARIMVAKGCSGGGVCAFCHEGNYTAGYSELQPGERVSLARAALQFTAADTFRPWAYNISSLTNLSVSIKEWRSIFPNVWLNNTRLDDLAECPALIEDFISDTRHIYAPIEGISDRIRNSFLNKGVTESHIQRFFDGLDGHSISVCKVGFIYTGYEDVEDWEEFRRMNAEIVSVAMGKNALIPVRYKGTMLVHYPHTPLYYAARKAAKLSFEGKGILSSPQMRKCLSEGMRMKMNGFKYSTFIEQAVLDLGRSLTPWFYTEYVSKGIFVDGFRSIRNADAGFAALRAFINADTFFNAKPIGALTPVDRIHLPHQSITLKKAHDIMTHGMQATYTPRCLRSYGTPNPKCSGCSLCQSMEERHAMTARPLEAKSVGRSKFARRSEMLSSAVVVRLDVERLRGFESLNPRHTVYTSVSRLLQAEPLLLAEFLSIGGYSTQGMSGNGEQYPFCGFMAIDVLFGADISPVIERAIQTVNRRSASFHIASCSVISDQYRIRLGDRNFFQFVAHGNVGLWEKCCAQYKGAILTTNKGMRRAIYDDTLSPPNFVVADDNTFMGTFSLPCKYSPWAYLQGIYTGHKIAAQWIFEHFHVVCFKFQNIDGAAIRKLIK